MHCMKCGRPIGEQGAFCKECLAVMERYPVKSGTKVMIPTPRTVRRPNRPQRMQRTPDEIISAQRRQIRRLGRMVAALLLLLAASVAVIFWRLYWERNMAPLGSNYSTAESTGPTVQTNVPRETMGQP